MRKKWNKSWGKSRYGEYYLEKMDPIWAEQWEKDLKQIKKLKKSLESLGPIPQKEVQVIKTTNYFVKLIELLTTCRDSCSLKHGPESKVDKIKELDDALTFYVGRKESVLCYLNKTEIGKTVNHNSLYIGLFEPLPDDALTEGMKIKKYKMYRFKILADYNPIVDWLNKKVITLDGNTALISQKALVIHITEIKKDILNTINSVLEN